MIYSRITTPILKKKSFIQMEEQGKEQKAERQTNKRAEEYDCYIGRRQRPHQGAIFGRTGTRYTKRKCDGRIRDDKIDSQTRNLGVRQQESDQAGSEKYFG